MQPGAYGSPIFEVIAGVLLLFLGRRLFWVFVGVIGFLAGMRFGAQLVAGQPEIVVLLIALGTGLIAALVAVLLQRLAVAAAGFFAGGMLAMQLAGALGWSTDLALWVAFLLGGVIAALLVSVLFDWTLIILSSLMGSLLVAGATPLESTVKLVLAVALFVIGLVVQARLLAPAPRSPRPAH